MKGVIGLRETLSSNSKKTGKGHSNGSHGEKGEATTL